MCRFVESIKLKDGVFYRLEFHQKRVAKAFACNFPYVEVFNLAAALQQSDFPLEGLFKCRVVYDSEIRHVEFVAYNRRKIRSLKLVETDMESYAYKREDRTGFDAAFTRRGDCDEVLLVRNGLLTDTSYCNIAIYDGLNWFTPRVPLLYGVNRAELLSESKLIEKDIKQDELVNFQFISLFNALIELGEMTIDIDKIY